MPEHAWFMGTGKNININRSLNNLIPILMDDFEEFKTSVEGINIEKAGETARPFRYDLDQIPYDYTVEVTNRFKGFDLTECLKNYWTEFSPVVQRVKRLPTVWETQVQSLGREVPLEKEMATHSCILAWRIQGQRSLVRHD